jgi:hypothetical protein
MRNPWLCITIVLTLGAGALLGTVGLVVLALYHVDAPQALVATVATCYGALSSFLVQPPRGSIGLAEGQKPE